MAYYFLKKYRCDGQGVTGAPLIGEWVLSAETPSGARELAESHLAAAGLQMPDSEFAILFDYDGKIIWDRGP